MEEARSSAAVVLALFWNVPTTAPEGLNENPMNSDVKIKET